MNWRLAQKEEEWDQSQNLTKRRDSKYKLEMNKMNARLKEQKDIINDLECDPRRGEVWRATKQAEERAERAEARENHTRSEPPHT